MMVPASQSPLLAVRRLKVHYRSPGALPWQQADVVKAVDDVGFNLMPGETLGIVGESGCGKSTLARALAGLQGITFGSVNFDGQEISQLSETQWRPLRRQIQMVFQDPLASLDPRMTIGASIAEPLEALCPELTRADREQRVRAMLDRVGLSPRHYNRYPHEFSGGQCQRVGIARALVVKPRVLICDEPVSALDVSVQAQIVNLLAELQEEYGLSMLFIAHDLAVVRHISQRVMVMYLGKVMEQATREALFEAPVHPYTRALLDAVPGIDGHAGKPLEGEIPSASNPPLGCVFVTRCPVADAVCGRQAPVLSAGAHGGAAACHFTGVAGS